MESPHLPVFFSLLDIGQYVHVSGKVIQTKQTDGVTVCLSEDPFAMDTVNLNKEFTLRQ